MSVIDEIAGALKRSVASRPETVLALLASKPEADLPAGRDYLEVTASLAQKLKFRPSPEFTKGAEALVQRIRTLRKQSADVADSIDFCGARELGRMAAAVRSGEDFTPRSTAEVRASLRARVKFIDTTVAELTARLADLARPECDALAAAFLKHADQIEAAEAMAVAAFEVQMEPPLSVRLLRRCARVVATLIPEPVEFSNAPIGVRFVTPWLSAKEWD